ncbi:Ran-binding protein 1 [Strigomonas culicis]|uniref:Ran-binding protein 1 n=1 Tax=Strigomonas culicis TaxID=28005 RepID=S9UZH6_9TRYP|nr:Ran-binding protein 1 [Strigomonas culicis]|eukprot:EPY34124.1 Ran-binding protein 1 [Strigomonas culicis]
MLRFCFCNCSSAHLLPFFYPPPSALVSGAINRLLHLRQRGARFFLGAEPHKEPLREALVVVGDILGGSPYEHLLVLRVEVDGGALHQEVLRAQLADRLAAEDEEVEARVVLLAQDLGSPLRALLPLVLALVEAKQLRLVLPHQVVLLLTALRLLDREEGGAAVGDGHLLDLHQLVAIGVDVRHGVNK